MRGQPAIGVHPPTTPRQRLHDPSPRVRQPLPGVLLPGLPPHAASPRSNNMHIASFQLAPLEKGGWLTCRRGGNTLPLHQRLEAAGSSSVLTLAGVLGASRALSIELTRMVAKGVPTATTLANICAICSETMGADEVSLLTAQRLDGMRTTTADGGRLDGGGAFLREPHFEKACGALTAGSPLCNRLSAALSHEMISAAENSISLNLHGDMSRRGPASDALGKGPPMPAAVDVGTVALRERDTHPGLVLRPADSVPLLSALVCPVADPATGSTVALLLIANSAAGYFNLADEIVAECVSLHLGLAWKHHIERLRLVPLPGTTLPSPDDSAELLQWQWQALQAGGSALAVHVHVHVACACCMLHVACACACACACSMCMFHVHVHVLPTDFGMTFTISARYTGFGFGFGFGFRFGSTTPYCIPNTGHACTDAKQEARARLHLCLHP